MDEHQLQEVCKQLDALQHERQTCEDDKISEEGRLRSGVENRLGYSTLLEEEERERICNLRNAIIEAAREGEPPPEGEECEAAYQYACNTIDNIRSWEQRISNAKSKQVSVVVKLPIWEWCDDVKGVSPNQAAKFLGSIPPNDEHEGHCLGQFEHKRQLFKFFRHGVRERDGRDQRDKKASEKRESVLWNLGEQLIKQVDEYYDIFWERKLYECRRDQENGLVIIGPTKTKEAWAEKDGLPEVMDKEDLEEVSDQFDLPDKWQEMKYYDLSLLPCFVSTGHLNNRAKRYMRKQFLADILEAWKELT